jgi:O-antigen/teichoic acid export membrane protein
MKLAVEDLETAQPAGTQEVIRKQIRGSSLLLSGRVLALGINFASQVLIVRYLSTQEYGAWAYALSLVALLQAFASLGLQRATNRFVPLYHERHDYARMYGTVMLAVGVVLLTGTLAVSLMHLFPGQISSLMSVGEGPFALLLILVFLAPVEALDGLLTSLFASFGRPQSIFFRKYLLGPGLKLTTVTLLVLLGSDVYFLAYGYLAASLVGIAIYAALLVRTWRREGLLERFRLSELKVPAKDLFGYTLPLMTSEIRGTVMFSTGALILGYYWTVGEVGIFRVVLPIATAMTTVFLQTFTMLYTPAVARLFAREDHGSVNDLYWRTTLWLAAISFPVFATIFVLARPLTVMVYGSRYEAAAVILSLLVAGTYFDTALGFNKLTLQIMGKTRFVMAANLGAATMNLALSLALIPRFGPVGAAVAAAFTMMLYNVVMQMGLRQVPGLRPLDPRYWTFYLVLGLAFLGLVLFRTAGSGNLLVGIVVVVLTSLLVLGLSRKHLDVDETFPELQRLPLFRALRR